MSGWFARLWRWQIEFRSKRRRRICSSQLEEEQSRQWLFTSQTNARGKEEKKKQLLVRDLRNVASTLMSVYTFTHAYMHAWSRSIEAWKFLLIGWLVDPRLTIKWYAMVQHKSCFNAMTTGDISTRPKEFNGGSLTHEFILLAFNDMNTILYWFFDTTLNELETRLSVMCLAGQIHSQI